MRVFAFACIIAAFCVATSLQDTPHYRCDDGPPPLELTIDGCNSSPCNIIKGTDLTARWDFVANKDAKSLKPRVMVTVVGSKMPYPYPEQDACKALTNGKCPLKKNATATYNLKMAIANIFPSLSLNIEFALVDENENVQVCFSVDAKVIKQ